MKIKANQKAFVNERIVKAGEIVEIKDKRVPSWAELVEPDKKQKENKTIKTQTKTNETEDNPNKDVDEAIAKANQDAIKGLSEDEKAEYLNILLEEAKQKGILFEKSEDKTVEEQIFEITESLKGKE